MSINDRIVQVALEHVGLCACSTTREQFRSLLGKPAAGSSWDLHNPYTCRLLPSGQYRTTGVSCCGLVTSGFQELGGLWVPYRERDYVIQSAVWRIIEHARSQRAYVEGEHRKWITPNEGDHIVIGKGIGTHVLTAVRWIERPEGMVLGSVDGGRVCRKEKSDQHEGRNLQAIEYVERKWWYGRDGLPRLGDRVVQGWGAVHLMQSPDR